MKVIRAEEMGMCFGVRDALQIAAEVEHPRGVTIHGELVHNRIVNRNLADAGFRLSSEENRDCDPETPVVLITAHGISNAERGRLLAADKQLIDTTCPLVRRVHDSAMGLAEEGRHVLLIGKAGHVEVRGITEDLDSVEVIDSIDSVRRCHHRRLGIISQTTMPPDLVADITARIVEQNAKADIRVIDTVCHPTKRRQQAILNLVRRVDAVVVVGGVNSNNTRRLVELCHQHQTPALHVQDADGIDADWLAPFETIGLTAGTSTLDQTIDDVQHAIERVAIGLPSEASER